jgi:hypothetical protein
MAIRAREAVAAEFLRNALAGEALAVPKLDAMAHAAGLLGERQHITQAKLFRRAKDALGIRSVREGFGAGGRWAWELPSSSDAPARIAATSQERSAPEPVIPREWVQGVARLEQDQPPADVPRHRWHQFVKDCHAFLNSPEAERAAQLGWDATALFGCRPNHPLSYLGKAGLLWQLSGGKITELHGDWVMIERPVNSSRSPFSRRDVDKDRVVLPWTLPLVKTE